MGYPLALLRRDPIQPVEFAKTGVRQRLQQNAVDDAEHRGVGADAQPECDDGEQRETGIGDELARREPEILQQPLEPAPPPRIPRLLPQDARVAESAMGRRARLVAGQTVRREVGLALLEVEAHLLRHLGLHAIATEQETETAGEATEQIHGVGSGVTPVQVPSSTIAMMALVRSQSFSSVSSCFRPARVRL